MSSTPLVSVTMPVYNGEKTIQLAISSLLNQTYKNWLCVIVNDCSTDGTASILSKYEKDPRFRIIHLPVNKGRGNARQVALENAEGEYICYLDADDFYHPHKLEKQVLAFNKHSDIILCSTGVGSFDKSYNLLTFRGFGKDKVENDYQSFFFPGFPASTMISYKIARLNKYNKRLNVGEDNDFIRKCLTGGKYFIINEILYFYEEINTITNKKLIEYQVENIKTIKLTTEGVIRFKLIIKELVKLLLKVIILTFIKADRIVYKRGSKVSSKDVSDFNEILLTLKPK